MKKEAVFTDIRTEEQRLEDDVLEAAYDYARNADAKNLSVLHHKVDALKAAARLYRWARDDRSVNESTRHKQTMLRERGKPQRLGLRRGPR